MFFLEIELADALLRDRAPQCRGSDARSASRSTSVATRISLHCYGSEWDHHDMPFERARDMLDGLLDWRALKPWSYRKGLGYLLRSQDDFRDVFHLRKFAERACGLEALPSAHSGLQRAVGRLALRRRKRNSSRRRRRPHKPSRTSWAARSRTSARSRASCCSNSKEARRSRSCSMPSTSARRTKRTQSNWSMRSTSKIAALNAERYSLNQTRRRFSLRSKRTRSCSTRTRPAAVRGSWRAVPGTDQEGLPAVDCLQPGDH